MTRHTWVCLLSLAPLTLSGCKRPANGPPASGTPEVQVAVPVRKNAVTDYEVFTGRTEAADRVDLRARVTGQLVEAKFKDGALVKKNELLFVIDQKPFRVELASTEASVGQAETRAGRTEGDHERGRALLARQAIGREEFEKLKGDRDEARDALRVARANVDRAKLNLEYTEIRAPFAGRIGRRMVDPGNHIKADETILTTLISLDEMHGYFDVDERTLLRQLLGTGALEAARAGIVPITIGLSDEEGYPHPALVNFIDNKIDPNTGTMWMRGIFERPTEFGGWWGYRWDEKQQKWLRGVWSDKPRTLAPGLFIRVRFPVSQPYEALLVAEQAISTDQGQKFVYVVDAQNRVEYRQVTVGRLNDGLRVIKVGLEHDEKVVVSGLQRVRAKAEVVPLLVPMPIRTTPEPGSKKPSSREG